MQSAARRGSIAATRRSKQMATRKVGRDAGSGQFIPVERARRDKDGAVVEKIKYPTPKPQPKPRGR